MRYFFHYGYYIKYPNPLYWVSTNELIETNEEGYNQTIEREEEIKNRHFELNIPWNGWHRPLKCENIPSDKIMHPLQPQKKIFKIG